MSDSKYFSTQKKGELFELKADLHSDKPRERKDAVKTVMAGMTSGKDMSSLFPDVVQNINAGDLEMKKLVYLYIMNYARSSPEQSNTVIHAFQKDVSDHNPLVRALALRTMGCIRVDKIAEFMVEPVQRAIKDEDPYVRKTAAVCVGKLYDINPEFVENMGFVDALRNMLSDSNPMVVANAVATLSEINDNSDHDLMKFGSGTVQKLLNALNECTEWGQVFILDALADYEPRDATEARNICERVQLRLQSGNAAVVLSSVKVLLMCLEVINDRDFDSALLKRLSSPLVTLLSGDSEIQYVALRNITLILQKYPDIMRHELKIFFVKYNDPIYVKIEKLEIMVRLAAEHNISQVLAELKQYAQEIDIDFVRKSVGAIGRCAVKIESAADQCISTLSELIQTKVNYLVQEAIVVIRDIFRKYPNRYEAIIGQLCENLESLDEPEAKAAMIWIIGEYSDRIDNAHELLESFAETFLEDPDTVQLALLTAVVKLFLHRPQTCQALVQRVLTFATQEVDNPDLRDRGYIYWRLLSVDPATAKSVVLSDKPPISEETDNLETSLLEELLHNIAMLASVYHKPPTTFIDPRLKSFQKWRREEDKMRGTGAGVGLLPHDRDAQQQQIIQQPQQADLIGDLLDLNLDDSYNQPQQPVGSDLNDLLFGAYPQGQPGMGGYDNNPFAMAAPAEDTNPFAATAPPPAPIQFAAQPAPVVTRPSSLGPDGRFIKPKQIWLTAEQGKGLEISGTFARQQGEIRMLMTFANKGGAVLSGFAIMFNKNSFALVPAALLTVASGVLAPGATAEVVLPVSATGPVQRMEPLNKLQVAVKMGADIAYFDCMVPDHVLFVEDGLMERAAFLEAWRSIPDGEELSFVVNDMTVAAQGMEERLRANNVYCVAHRTPEPNQDVWYASIRYTNGVWVLLEITVVKGQRTGALAVRTRTRDVIQGVYEAVAGVLSA